MQLDRDDPGATRIATLDIETTHFKPARGEVVSVGVAAHERGTPGDEVDYSLVHRDGGGEADTIERGLDTLIEIDPDLLVTFNGKGFDLDFLRQRLHRLEVPPEAFSLPGAQHVDLFVERQRRATRRDEKWPKLEECLEAYGLVPARTVWKDEEVTNKRFGETLGPAYLQAVAERDAPRLAALRPVIEHYLTTDLEANLALYYADIGAAFEPAQLGTDRRFSQRATTGN